MEKDLEVNNRRLSPTEQESLRKRIVRSVKKHMQPNGKVDVVTVAEVCECSAKLVRNVWKAYITGGLTAIKLKGRGRPKNSGSLTVSQQREIQRLIVDKCPEQLKLKGFLWDRQQVCGLILRLFKIKLTVQAVGKYLKKWGFSSQRPVKRNYKQNPIEIKKWLDEEYPAIKERAKQEKAEISWADETCCQNESNYVKGYAPIGQTPTLPVGNEHFRISMISAVTNQGKLRFMFYKGGMDAEKLIVFMRRLIKDSNRKIFLILDNLKAHHAKTVSEWTTNHKSEIELFFLPAYAPEYNPDEYLNGKLKRELAKKGYSKTVDELESKARGTMKTLQAEPNNIAAFFQAPQVRYAA